VAELLKRGAAVDAATKKGNTALHIASLGKSMVLVNLHYLGIKLHLLTCV
jgi:ankyrin repeat protein